MSVDTHGITEKVISGEEIFNFIRTKFDPTAELRMDAPEHSRQTGRIEFKYKDKEKFMFIVVGSFNDHKELTAVERYTWLDLYNDENSVEIMKAIINQFGGWVEEDDYDDEGYYYIPANPDKDVPPVIRVTMQDIYDKFGGIVVITK